MRLLVFGATGQIGHALIEDAQKRGWEVPAPSHAEVDICDRGAVAAALRRHTPVAILNAAGYTAVDRAESERDQAFRVNRDGAHVLAEMAATADLPLVHLSTDYVFDGLATAPYIETDALGPHGVYAKSKEQGERAVRVAAPKHVILRTAWVFSPFGTNFLRTMLRLGAERAELSVVDDQTGCPTAASDVANAITTILMAAQVSGFAGWGTYHCAGADAVTWFGFAKAIFESAARFGLTPPKLYPVTTADYPRPAPRPAYSVLSTAKLERTFGIQPRPLRDSLTECLIRLRG
ncbi:MAG: dTDP-4-dehydrorhamnose reductase [Methyloceanibacter sp.]|uniref:dTDP-4-dehydrorhamnose reductase n=1 Tax=Methyloceanibacter sp. TaxID=1965321 RepID=UPI003D9B8A00